MLNNAETLIVVLSRNYSTGLSVIRSLGSLGYTIDLVASAPREGASHDIAQSKYLRNAVEVVADKVKDEDDTEFINELLKYDGAWPTKPVVIAADDYTASVMDKHRTELSCIFILPGIVDGDPGSLTRMMDKSVQGELARKVGIPTPKEWVISLREEEFSIPEEMVYPCFVKPLGSTFGFKQEMARCDDKLELTDHLSIMRESYANRSVLVQQFMHIDEEYDIEGVAMDQTILIPGVIWKKYVAQYDRGVPLAGSTYPMTMFGEFQEKIYAFLKEFHYCGMFDLGINVINGEFYFNELNLRSGGTNYVYYKSGANLSELYVKAALKENLPGSIELPTYGKTYLYEKVAYDDVTHDYLDETIVRELANSVDIPIMCDSDDPVPGNLFMDDIEERLSRWKKHKKTEAQREACISSAMELTGWDREYAEKQVDDARERLGITYARYQKHQFALISPEDQQKIFEDLFEEYKRKTTVVVLSRNYSTGVAVIRSLGSVGFNVELVASASSEGKSEMAAVSKYVGRAQEVVTRKVKFGEDHELIDVLMAYKEGKKKRLYLLPTDDYTASIADLHKDQLETVFKMPGIIGEKKGSLVAFMDKHRQSEIAREVGLPVPKEWVISLETDISLPDGMVYPCYVKPLESISGYKSEMAKCDTEEELLDHLDRMKGKFTYRSILVQEFLDITQEIDLSGVCLDQEVIIPAIIKKTGVAQHEKGVTLSGQILPFEEINEELREKIIEMMQQFHYNGLFDMEFNIAGGKIYFNEVNFRSGGPNFSYFMSGVNLPALFIREMMRFRHRPEDEQVTEYGKTFINDQAAWDDYVYGHITKRELQRIINESDIRLMEFEEDPEPFNVFMNGIRNKNKKQKRKGMRNSFRKKFGPFLRILWHALLGYPQTRPWNRRRKGSNKPRVLVSGRNYCSNLCMARSLGEAGYDVEVLRIYQSLPKNDPLQRKMKKRLIPDAHSRYIKGFYTCLSKRKDERILNRLIRLSDPDKKMLLLPADDLIASLIDRYYDELSNYFIMPSIKGRQGEVDRFMQKNVQKAMAAKAGLPLLNSCMISTSEGKYDVPETVTYPCFIKPNVSARGAKGRMNICRSEEELRAAIDEYALKQDVEFLVEDYVEIGRELSIMGVSTRNGANGPGFFAAEKNGAEEHRGVAITGRILPHSEMQELIDKCIAFVGSLGYDGLYDVDLIETTGGDVYFLEVNMRAGASGYAVTKCGVNLPGMFADYMLKGTPVDLGCQLPTTGKSFISEKVLIEEYIGGRISFDKIDEWMDEADIHFIKNDTDPKAYRHFKRFYGLAKKMRQMQGN